MSNLTVKGNASGTGTTTLESPNTNTSSTVTLPDATTTLVGTADFASQAQAEAGTDNATLMTPLRTEQHTVANNIGYNQTWQTVTRTSGVSYQNLTGKPIQVAIGANNTSVNFEVSTNGSTWVSLGTTGTNVPSIFFAIIPPGHYYRATGGVSTAVELR
jgi:hypothetical protein